MKCCMREEIYIRMRSDGNAPEKWRTNSWFLPHDNAPAHRSYLVKDILAKNNVTTLEHPPYSHDLTEADFYPFPQLKSALKGRRICDATDIIKNATVELKRLSPNGFHECFQQIYSRWKKSVQLHKGTILKKM